MENTIVINKFLSYLSINAKETDDTLLAYAVMSELEIEGITLTTERKNHSQLYNFLNTLDIVHCRIAIENKEFLCKVGKSSNQYVLTVIKDEIKEDIKCDKILTTEDVLNTVNKLTSNNSVENIKFRKHINSILTPDFFKNYFDKFSDCVEVEEWLVNYRDNWNW